MHRPHAVRPARLVAPLLVLVLAGCANGSTTSAPVGSAAGSLVPSETRASSATSPTSSATPPASSGTEASASPSSEPGSSPGQTRTDRAGVGQVWVPPGTFTMGTDAAAISALTVAAPPSWVVTEFPSEVPAHTVQLTHGYWIDTDEVTNAAFAAFKAAGGYTNRSLWSDTGWTWLSHRVVGNLPLSCVGDAPTIPRLCVTWFEAEAYAAWRGGRLPTEAEWEYAARGPDSQVYPWGETFDAAKANVVDSSGPVPVGSYPAGASWVGARDMSGNAMEWVADWLDPAYYATSPASDPTGPETGTIKVEKGGWWGSNLFVARSAYRHYEDAPTYQDHHIGFRIVTP
jgi:formylglycine-generating enzyme required for sulfatase activity